MDQANSKNKCLVLGVDVGGTKILTGRMDRSCGIGDTMRFPTRTGSQDDIVSSILDALEQSLKRLPAPPSAIGMGLVGHVDAERGIWKNAINISVKEPVNICAMIRERFGIPAFIDNDVHTATRAELCFGAGRRAENFIYINIGTGISAGLVFGGRIIKGASNYAGEIGHMVSGAENHICKCGREGCLEPLISGGGIINMAKSGAESRPDSMLAASVADGTLDAGTVYRAAKQGDALASEIVEAGIRALEQTAVNLVNLLNPSLLVFGGGALEKDIILGRVKDFIYRNSLPVAAGGLEDVCLSELDPAQVGLIGAGSLAWSSFDRQRSGNIQ